jgi:RNA polymerase sigma-70 factor (ECF subfamily)
MSSEPSFADLMAQLRQGDQEAARLIFQRFADRLVALARSHLNQRLLQKMDPEDVMQSALKSFFLRQAEGRFHLDSWDSLWALLTVITLRKCSQKVEHFQAGRRDFRREAAPMDADDSASWEAIAREPTPEEAAQLADLVEQLFGSLKPDDRSIAELALQGYSPTEISARTGLGERTVYRRLERIKTRIEQSGR